MKRCDTCKWSAWTVEKPPCKECAEVGAFHKWQEKKEFPPPKPVYIGHRE